ncbi:MAG: glycerol-3-phosphate 1-O-acyltransferase PlsY, partial [Acidobacteriota bacterium]
MIAVGFAYLCGSIPFGLLVVRHWRGQDLRTLGSGNIGATNAMRAAGFGVGLFTLALDLAKGMAGFAGGWLVAGRVADLDVPLAGALIAAPVVGHMFPVWLRFRGGKGVATALGTLLVADAQVFAIALVALAVLALPTRRVSLGSLAAAASMPLAAWWFHGTAPAFAGALIVGTLTVLRHHDNIRRLV